MPRDGSGNYTPPVSSVDPAVPFTTISSSDFNALVTDITAELTDSADRSGKGAMLAALGMGAFKITNLGVPTLASDGARLDTVTGVALVGDVTGTPGGNTVANVGGGKTGGLTAGALPAAGKIGEVLQGFGTNVNFPSGAGSNIATISLTAGNWLIYGTISTAPAPTTTTSNIFGTMSLTSSSLTPINVNSFVQVVCEPTGSAGQAQSYAICPAVVLLSATTTIFLTAQVIFGVSTMGMSGRIMGVRI